MEGVNRSSAATLLRPSLAIPSTFSPSSAAPSRTGRMAEDPSVDAEVPRDATPPPPDECSASNVTCNGSGVAGTVSRIRPLAPTSRHLPFVPEKEVRDSFGSGRDITQSNNKNIDDKNNKSGIPATATGPGAPAEPDIERLVCERRVLR